MNIKLLESLCRAFGVSGREDEIAETIKSDIVCDEVTRDRAGNLICIKKSTDKDAPTVMIDAHMDSVGLCVKEVLSGGFLKFTTVGGIDPRVLPAAKVLVCTKGGDKILGVISTKPPHLMDKKDREKTASVDRMLIDTGDCSENISVGDRVQFYPAFRKLISSVNGTYLDNRAGCAAVIEVFERLKDEKLPFHLAGVFSVGEESGLKGASSTDFKADIALVIDATFGRTPFDKSDETFVCSEGVAIGTGPNVNRAIQKGLEESAARAGIPYQIEVLEGCSGTNAWSYQVQGFGIPCGMLSFPLKHMHTPAEVLSIKDFDATADTAAAYLRALTKAEILRIAGDVEC